MIFILKKSYSNFCLLFVGNIQTAQKCWQRNQMNPGRRFHNIVFSGKVFSFITKTAFSGRMSNERITLDIAARMVNRGVI